MTDKNSSKPSNAATNHKSNKMSDPVKIALIGLIGTIITALLGSTLIDRWFPSISDPTPTATYTLTATFTSTVLPTQSPSPTPTPTPTVTSTTTTTFTSTPTLTNTATASPSPTPETDKMYASLVANLLEGRAPLNVNFDARDSYVRFVDKREVACGNSRFCSFTFTIILDSQSAETIHNNEGRLSYNFSRSGEYIVAVYVCRGGACDEDSVMINIR